MCPTTMWILIPIDLCEVGAIRLLFIVAAIAFLVWSVRSFRFTRDHSHVSPHAQGLQCHAARSFPVRYGFAPSVHQLASYVDFCRQRTRVAAVTCAMVAVLLLVGVVSPAAMLGLFALGSSVVACVGLSTIRPFISGSAGTNAARLRAVGINDYLPARTRIAMWAGSLLALTVAAWIWFTQAPPSTLPEYLVPRQIVVGALALLALRAPITEWLAHRVAALPQPASNPADLLFQDALRTEALHQGYQLPLLAVALVTQAFVNPSPALAIVGFLIAAVSLLLVVDSQRSRGRHMRSRLWPETARGIADAPPLPSTSLPNA